MAERGRPLPLSVKEQIKQRHAAKEPLRKIATELQISKTTAGKFGTKPLQGRYGRD